MYSWLFSKTFKHTFVFLYFLIGVKFNSSVPNPIPLPDEVDTRENEIVAPEFTNRNPLNLERLAIARKDLGWKTSWPKRDYWYR